MLLLLSVGEPAATAAADSVYGYNCLSSSLDAKIDDHNLERSFSFCSDAGKDALFMMKRRCSETTTELLLYPTNTAATLFMGCVERVAAVRVGDGGGNDYERQHILCFNAVEIEQQQQQQQRERE